MDAAFLGAIPPMKAIHGQDDPTEPPPNVPSGPGGPYLPGTQAPPVTVPLGLAYTIATDALAIVGSAASAAKILGFATGGYVSGAGTGTSDSIPAMLSNGESVMNANTTATFAPLLSYLNQAGGGVGFSGPASSAARLNDGA